MRERNNKTNLDTHPLKRSDDPKSRCYFRPVLALTLTYIRVHYTLQDKTNPAVMHGSVPEAHHPTNTHTHTRPHIPGNGLACDIAGSKEAMLSDIRDVKFTFDLENVMEYDL